MRVPRTAVGLVALAAVVVLALVLRGRERRADALLPEATDGESAAPVAEPPFVSGELEAAIVAERTPAELEAVAGVEESEARAPSADRARLRVTLTWGGDRAPAAGITTKVMTWGAPDPFRDVQYGVSDGRGVFELEELSPGTATLYVDRGGNGRVELVAGETAELAIEIPAGIELVGRVLGPDGAPVPHAAVFLSDHGNASEGQVVTSADAGGRYLLRGVGEGRCVAAFAKGHAPSLCTHVEGSPGERVELDLVLPALGAALEGLVRGPDGAPRAGAEVLVGSEHPTSTMDSEGRRVSQAPPRVLVTGAEGRFAAEGLAPGVLPVAVRAQGCAPWSDRVELRVGERGQVEVVLQRGATIHGSVLDSSSQPVAGAFVGVGRYGDFGAAQTRSAADGSYRLPGLAAGQVEVRASERERGKVVTTLALVAGAETRWDARLVAGGQLGGVVLDQAGAPLVGWSVQAEQRDSYGSYLKLARTNAAGRFLLENCPPETYQLAVHQPDGSRYDPALVVREPRLGDTDLVLRVMDDQRATAWVTGRLVGPDHAPPAAARVVSWSPGSFTGVNHKEIDGEGRFRAGPFKPGSQRLVFSSPDLAERSVRVEDLAAGEERDLGDVQLEQPGVLVVQLARADGEEVDRRVWLSATPLGGGARQFISHEGGVGRTSALAPGTWIVRATGMDLACTLARVDLSAGAEARLDVVLEPGTMRSVELSLPAGAELTGLTLRVLDEAGDALSDDELPFGPDSDPSFLVSGLRVGTYRVEVTTGSGRSGAGELVVESLERSAESITIDLR